ncbi:hypothetical protein B4907_07065 [Yersinia kristensenii]|nr:hypothetical protein B4907_07065 [Yersinia kristensenii]
MKTIEERYVWSKSLLLFFPALFIGDYTDAGWDLSDCIEVSDDIFNEYSQQHPAGKIRGIGADDMPCWIDAPPPPHEEIVLIAQSQKEALITKATDIIAPMRDAKDDGYIDDEDIPRLAAWQKYRYALTKVDMSNAPDIEWPVAPE